MSHKKTSSDKLDKIVADTHRNRDQREKEYREQALKLYPWICGRCSREFNQANIRELTVHHRDHNHDNNPSNGSNWELLCLYCHDNEHQRQVEAAVAGSAGTSDRPTSTHAPFAGLRDLLVKKQASK